MKAEYGFVVLFKEGPAIYILKDGKDFNANYEVAKVVKEHNTHQGRQWTWQVAIPIIDSHEKLKNRRSLYP